MIYLISVPDDAIVVVAIVMTTNEYLSILRKPTGYAS